MNEEQLFSLGVGVFFALLVAIVALDYNLRERKLDIMETQGCTVQVTEE